MTSATVPSSGMAVTTCHSTASSEAPMSIRGAGWGSDAPGSPVDGQGVADRPPRGSSRRPASARISAEREAEAGAQLVDLVGQELVPLGCRAPGARPPSTPMCSRRTACRRSLSTRSSSASAAAMPPGRGRRPASTQAALRGRPGPHHDLVDRRPRGGRGQVDLTLRQRHDPGIAARGSAAGPCAGPRRGRRARRRRRPILQRSLASGSAPRSSGSTYSGASPGRVEGAAAAQEGPGRADGGGVRVRPGRR